MVHFIDNTREQIDDLAGAYVKSKDKLHVRCQLLR